MNTRYGLAFLISLMLIGCAAIPPQQRELAGLYEHDHKRHLRFFLDVRGLYVMENDIGAAWGTWRVTPGGQACFTFAVSAPSAPQIYGRHNPAIASGQMTITESISDSEPSDIVGLYREGSRVSWMDAQKQGIPSTPLVLRQLNRDKEGWVHQFRFTPDSAFNEYLLFAGNPNLPTEKLTMMVAMDLPFLFGQKEEISPKEAAGSLKGQEFCGRIALNKRQIEPERQKELEQTVRELAEPTHVERQGRRYERQPLVALPDLEVPNR
jgi:hypothetical protein